MDAPIPLKEYLMMYCGFSRSQWKAVKKVEIFYLNGCDSIASRTMVSNGDVISWDVSAPRFIPADMPLTIYYEDDALVVLEKPAGIVVHPTSGDHTRTIANALAAHWLKQGDEAAFHPVHRLDRYTSGLLLVAKHPETQHLLQQAGKSSFQRQYAAICEGILLGEGVFDAPIGRKDGSIIEREVRPDGKAARTHYTALAHENGCTLLRLRLETGRTHQIRVHLSHAGHPLLGDSLYGGTSSILTRQALHAYRLAFTHPHTGKRLSFCSPLPSDMRALFDTFDTDI
ncbi:RluA family pseudouridine synthase [Selenomonas sp. TAMA-11512]|uniref:RluA family pseudouridine synthase n=1 Tax=Selenomonas sp. TAMA-11512 TaxID=3095337 RepID=UPI0030D05FF9